VRGRTHLPVTARIDGRLVVLDEGDDRLLLVGRQLPVTELRHVLRSAEHCPQICRSVASVSAGAYLPWESAPPCPVKLWQDAQLSRYRLAAARDLRIVTQIAGRDCRTAAVCHDVGAEQVDLLGSEQRFLPLDLRTVRVGRHAAAGDLEVHGGLADPDQ